MNKTHNTRRLSHRLLLAMIVALLLSLLFDRIYEYSVVRHHEIEQQSIEQINEMSYALARDYSQLLMAGRLQDLSLSITARGTQSLINKVSVSDQSGIVIASSKIDDHGHKTTEVDALFDQEIASKAAKTNQIMVRLSSDHNAVLGYAPLSLPPPKGKLRSLSRGVLFIHMNILPLKVASWKNLTRWNSILRWLLTFVLASLLLGYILLRYLFRPLRHLEQTADQFGKGDWQARSELTGTGELARLGYVLNKMRDRILDDLNCRKQAEEELREFNCQLAMLASTDQLTNIANRRQLTSVLDKEISRADRYKINFSLILVDIDDFKSINDQYGHDAGDQTLIQVAEILSGCSRKSDHAGRWGGEEFLIVCPETNLNAATDLAELLRKRIELHDFTIPVSVTASFGVASHQPGINIDTLIKMADDALYQAKADSKNCVKQQPNR